ncbi:MAG: hypothetical protein B5M53_00090 [Candidatus Cloacimonas sp. 4484_209]|nr:MAG: hypothetical protein B5M53_00090 [Candidatus Cloacimonas sp. 4484_209]
MREIQKSRNKRRKLFIKALVGCAEVHNLAGDNVDAMKYAESAIKLLMKWDMKKEMSLALMLKGNILGDMGRFGSFEKMLNEAIAICQTIKFKDGEASGFISIGLYYEITGCFKKAKECYLSAIRILTKTGNMYEMANCYNNLGSVYNTLGEYKKALYYYKKALNIRRKIKDARGESETLNNIAYVYEDLYDYEKALYYNKQSLDIREKIGYKKGKGITFVNMGHLLLLRGYYDKALTYLIEGARIFQEIGSERLYAKAINNLAYAYLNLGYLKKSKKLLTETLDIRKRLKDRYGAVYTIKNFGYLYLELNKLDMAKRYLKEARKIADGLSMESILPQVLNGLFEIYLKRHFYKEAIKCLQQSLEISIKSGLKKDEGYTLFNFGRYYSAKKIYTKAENYFEKSLKVLNEVNEPFSLGVCFYHYGVNLFIMNKQRGAKEFLHKAESIFKKLGLKWWLEKTKNAKLTYKNN